MYVNPSLYQHTEFLHKPEGKGFFGLFSVKTNEEAAVALNNYFKL